MPSPDPAAIKALARRCAESGLRLRDARHLFDALYRADALRLSGGHQAGAARIAGVERATLTRMRNRNPLATEGQA